MTEKVRTRQDFEPIIDKLKTALKNKYRDFVGITFFGSRFRGDFRADSDFDIVVMFAEKPGWQKEGDVLGIILEFEIEYDIVIDAKIYWEKEIQKQDTPFRVTICNDGAYYGA